MERTNFNAVPREAMTRQGYFELISRMCAKNLIKTLGNNQAVLLSARYYSLIVAIESDTRKYHEFIAAYWCECVARVTMLEAMNE